MELSVEEKLERLWDTHEIKNLMARYEYYYTSHKHSKTVDLFALERDDCWVQEGAGFFKGADGIKRFFYDWHTMLDGDCKGVLNIHTLTTEIIEVARDGLTAKAVWMSPGVETRVSPRTKKHQGHWCWVKYAVDFIKEQGQWKMWHFGIFGDLFCEYENSWTKHNPTAEEAFVMTDTPHPDAPSSFEDTIYSTERAKILLPCPPVPYDTYDGPTIFTKGE